MSLEWHSRGQGFDSPQLHHLDPSPAALEPGAEDAQGRPRQRAALLALRQATGSRTPQLSARFSDTRRPIEPPNCRHGRMRMVQPADRSPPAAEAGPLPCRGEPRDVPELPAAAPRRGGRHQARGLNARFLRTG